MSRPIQTFTVILIVLALVVYAFKAVGMVSKNTNTEDTAEVFDTTATVDRSLDEQRDSIVAQEARRVGNPVLLALAISHVENWGGDSMAISKAGRQDSITIRKAIAGDQKAIDSLGAVGIMQVLPRLWWHAFEAECGCGSLFNRQINACKGNHILRFYLKREKTIDGAIRAYHGSTYRHNQGDAYASLVLEKMTRLSHLTNK